MKKIPKGQNIKYYPEIVEQILNPKTSKFNKKNKCQLMEKKHKKALEDMAQNPKLIGINNALHSEIEKKLYKNSKVKGEIDAIIINYEHTYFIEYKCNDCELNRNKAKKQLKRIPNLIEKKYNLESAKFLYVYGKFETYELTSQGFIPFNYTPTQ